MGTDKALDGLTDKQRMFVNGLSMGKGHTEAALYAGYAASGARTRATELMKHPAVMRYMQQIQQRVEDQNDITRAEVIDNIRWAIDKAKEGTPILDRYGKDTGKREYHLAPLIRGAELEGRAIGMWTNAQLDITVTSFSIDIDRAGDHMEQDTEEPVDAMFHELPEISDEQ